MKQLYNDITNEELFKKAVERASKLGAVDNADVVIILEDEIQRMRKKLTEYEVHLDEKEKENRKMIEQIDAIGEEFHKLKKHDSIIITIQGKQKIESFDVYFQEEGK